MKKIISSLLLSCWMMGAVQAQDDAPLVSVATVKEADIHPSIWLPANVQSRYDTPISAEQSGQLNWVEIVGTDVQQGDIIAKIDNRDLKLQLSQQQTQAQILEAEVDYLTKQQQRMKTLSERQNTAQNELDHITNQLISAISQRKMLEIAIQQTQLALEKTAIKAPFSGSISQRFVDQGQLIQVGMPIVQLISPEHLDIKVAAPLSLAPFLQQDLEILVKWQNRMQGLRVDRWSKGGNARSRTFDVYLKADGLDLLSGTAVSVALPSEMKTTATMIPRDALVLRKNETYIMTLDPQQQAKQVAVAVKQGQGNWVAVQGDVQAGEPVVVRGAERLKQGEKVQINAEQFVVYQL